MATMKLERFRKIGPGFYNLKIPFYCVQYLKGMIDIGTHMSLVKIESTGKFLVLDVCSLDSVARSEFDFLTNKGLLIDAVIATHPFHTTYFETFYKSYPTLKYYGTPRHIKKLTTISWTGDISNEDTLKLWEPEVSMRIPEGAEFKNPEENNRFSSVFVFHKQSKTIHDDDTIMHFDAEHLSCCLRLAGLTSRRIIFHPSLTTVGLYKFPEAVKYFKEWMRKIIDDWDFENVCTAHYGVVLRDGKKMLKQTLKNYENKFIEMSRQCSAKVLQSNSATSGIDRYQPAEIEVASSAPASRNLKNNGKVYACHAPTNAV